MTDEQLLAKAHALKGGFVRRTRTMEDFRYDEQQERYWDTTTGNLLGARSVDGAIPRDQWPAGANNKLSRPSGVINAVETGLTVEGSTWWPGLPQFIEDVVITDRGAIPVPGAVCYNAYVPAPDAGSHADPGPWVDHVRRLYKDTAEHFFDFCAHMIQRPDQKVNHGIVMGGSQGIGKDTALLPVRAGVGEWNVAEIAPDTITDKYNGYVKSVLLIINEVRPHDEHFKASNFYNKLKPILAAPPPMLAMEMKYMNTIYVRNLCHVILTTNHPLAMYIPDEDRRLFVMSSTAQKDTAEYFDRLHGWLNAGGVDAVVGWLRRRSLEGFDPMAPPPMTAAKRQVMDSAAHVRRHAIDDVLDQYLEDHGEGVSVIFHRDLSDYVRTTEYFDDEAALMKQLNAASFHYKMADRGFQLLRNPHASEWRRGKFRSRVVFVRGEGDLVRAAQEELEKRG